MAERRRMLLFTPWPSIWSMAGGGGTPSGAKIVAAALEAGFDVDILSIGGSDDDSFPDDPRVKVHRLGRRWSTSRSYPGRWLELLELTIRFVVGGVRIGRRSHPALIYAFSCPLLPAAAICSRLLRTPVIGVIFGTYLAPVLGTPQWRLKNFEEVIGFKTPVDRLVIVNDATKGDEVARVLRVPSERVRFWMHGIDVEASNRAIASAAEGRRLARAEGRPLLVSASRLADWKRIDAILRIMPGVLAEFPSAVLAISGSGPERERLGRLVDELGIGESVRFLGALSRETNYSLLAAADVFCSFYDFTNVGNATLEAMSCGVATVATDSGATRDFIVDGVHGLVVPTRDDAKALEAVLRLLGDDELRHRLGANARERALNEFPDIGQRRELELALLDEVAPA